MVPDRFALAHGLEEALAAPDPTQGLNDLLRAVLATEPVTWEADERRLVRAVSERVDVASGDASRLVPLARNVQTLLQNASSSHAVELLLELIAGRERAIGILGKHVQGVISRNSLLSFVAEQRWPESVRRRVAALSRADVESLVTALEQLDVIQLEALLVA